MRALQTGANEGQSRTRAKKATTWLLQIRLAWHAVYKDQQPAPATSASNNDGNNKPKVEQEESVQRSEALWVDSGGASQPAIGWNGARKALPGASIDQSEHEIAVLTSINSGVKIDADGDAWCGVQPKKGRVRTPRLEYSGAGT